MIIASNFKDLTGKRFNRWTVIKRAPNHVTKGGNVFTMWTCVCDCGTVKDVFANSLLNKRSTSCGCEHKEKQRNIAKKNFSTHQESKERLYKIWAGIKKRCTNPNASNYMDYGGRGISLCPEWHEYLSFKRWALSSGYTDTLSIDRIDVNGNYCPDNCRWVDSVAQANNRRSSKYYTIDGISKTLAQWAREYNKPYKSLWKKLSKGCNLRDLLLN